MKNIVLIFGLLAMLAVGTVMGYDLRGKEFMIVKKPLGYTLISVGVGVDHNSDTIKVKTFREKYNHYKQLTLD